MPKRRTTKEKRHAKYFILPGWERHTPLLKFCRIFGEVY